MEIKLVNVPKTHRDTFPPYGLALINAFLNNNSIKSDIFDLDIITKHHNSLNKISDFTDLEYLRKEYHNLYTLLKQKKIDEHVDLQFENMLKKLDLKNCDIIGLNSHDNEIYVSLCLAKKIREKKDCTVIIGGSHVTRINIDRLKQLINDLDIDYVDYFVPGYPYDFFLELYEHKLDLNPKGKAAIYEKKRTPVDVNNYKIPLYNKEHLELYKIKINELSFYHKISQQLLEKFEILKNAKPVLVLPFKFLEGCANNCAFCHLNNKGNTFKLDIETVLSNIKIMKEKYGCENFYFLNNNIVMDKEYAVKIFKRISEEVNIRWCDSASINNLDTSIIKLMAGSGCIQLLFGLESASPKLLRYTNKNSGYNKISYYTKCFKECDKKGIWVLVDLIAGLPYETSKDVQTTINYLETNRNIINGIFVNRFMLSEKSDFFNNHGCYGLKLLEDDFTRASESEFSNCHKTYYRTFMFDETRGLKWEDKAKQVDQSLKTLRSYLSKKFEKHFYFCYPLFFLYNTFQNDKKSIIAFLNN